MRFGRTPAIALAIGLLATPVYAQQEDADKKVGGGVQVKGWTGKADAGRQGLTINDAKFAAAGKGFSIMTGPPAIFWNPSHTATGDYTVKATFKEAKQNYNHPHPVGVFIAGKNLDSDAPSYVYCMAYRSGNFIVNQFVDGKVVPIVKRTPHAAVDKATGPDDDVTQEVGWVVKGGKAECTINGQVVHAIDTSTVKLDSTDGIYGLRTSHNMEVTVAEFGKK
jgi:hypothetical protein